MPCCPTGLNRPDAEDIGDLAAAVHGNRLQGIEQG
jgi:hypothetical protein